ncbi:hypothetical protein [Pseudomonas sp. LS-2]|uniref:hypothetical protein n=1 Tax=Pseudomonas sp. LS-2 TaxID=2315859 RepID=UPI000E7286AD|nr:hypothetical protein [Pseudomonas sp. LS-2]RJX72605.1 hypothetical protein D3M70_30850 [Pseudomonas sp. LS-2]
MKNRTLAQLVEYFCPAVLIIVATAILAMVFSSSAAIGVRGAAFGIALFAIAILGGSLKWGLMLGDTSVKRELFKRALMKLWSQEIVPFDTSKHPFIRAMRLRPLPASLDQTCWSFDIDCDGYPGYESLGFIHFQGPVISMAMVSGVRGRWHLDCYVRATCTPVGTTFYVESVDGPLKSWLAPGSVIGVDLESGNEGLGLDSIGLVRMFRSDIPAVLKNVGAWRVEADQKPA